MAVELPQRRSLPRRLVPLLVIVAIFGFLAMSQLRTSEEGVGDQNPLLTIDAPVTADAGSTQTIVLTVENPAASDIDSLFVSFSALGTAGGTELPSPIVQGNVRGIDSAVVDIEPEPVAQGEGVRFGFGPLGSGETKSIRFELRMPETTGEAANSIAVYDGTVPERADGGSIEISIES